MNKEEKSITNGEVIDYMVQNNSFEYNLIKAAEELNELSEVLLKRFTKAGTSKEPENTAILDEIGDVQIRLQVLKKLFGEQAADDRVQFKLNKYKGYINDKLYVGRI